MTVDEIDGRRLYLNLGQWICLNSLKQYSLQKHSLSLRFDTDKTIQVLNLLHYSFHFLFPPFLNYIESRVTERGVV